MAGKGEKCEDKKRANFLVSEKFPLLLVNILNFQDYEGDKNILSWSSQSIVNVQVFEIAEEEK